MSGVVRADHRGDFGRLFLGETPAAPPPEIGPPVERLSDWRKRLDAYINARRHRPFDWGLFDCGAFAAGAVYAQTGVNMYRRLGINPYKTAAGAARELKRMDCLGVTDAVSKVLPEIAAARATVGDLAAFITDEHGPALGVVGGGHAYIVNESGLGLRSMRDAARAWAV